MTDIVERLRNWPVAMATCDEAADEIKRLRDMADSMGEDNIRYLHEIEWLRAALGPGAVEAWQHMYDEIERLRAKINPLVMFARWAISEGSWAGLQLDGGDVQNKAEELGLITKTKYDPAIHGESAEAEPGDDWYVFTEATHDRHR